MRGRSARTVLVCLLACLLAREAAVVALPPICASLCGADGGGRAAMAAGAAGAARFFPSAMPPRRFVSGSTGVLPPDTAAASLIASRSPATPRCRSASALPASLHHHHPLRSGGGFSGGGPGPPPPAIVAAAEHAAALALAAARAHGAPAARGALLEACARRIAELRIASWPVLFSSFHCRARSPLRRHNLIAMNTRWRPGLAVSKHAVEERVR